MPGAPVFNLIAAPGPTGPGYLAVSTSSQLVGTGGKVFTTAIALAYLPGDRVRVTSRASGAYMEGLVSAYLTNTLSITVDRVNGSGSYADWNIGLAGDVGATGPVGLSYTPRGTWLNTTAYIQGDMVLDASVNGNYVCLVSGTGHIPNSSPTFWQPAGSFGATGAVLSHARMVSSNVSVTTTVIPWDTNVVDVGGLHSTTVNPSRFTIPAGQGGYYLVSTALRFDLATAGGANFTAIAINKNGTQAGVSSIPMSGAGVVQTFSMIVALAAGDYIEIQAVVSPSPLNVLASADQTFCQVYRLS